MHIRLVPALILAALAGACSTVQAYEPSRPQGARVGVAWEQCDASCRHAALRDMCPGAPEPKNASERYKLEAGLMKYDSHSTLESHMRGRPECASRRTAHRPIVLAQNQSYEAEAEADFEAPPPSMRRPGYSGGNFRGRGMNTFENVARGSLHVRAAGKKYDLRNIGGNTRTCQPPQQLVRSERCSPLPRGGIRCAFDCR